MMIRDNAVTPLNSIYSTDGVNGGDLVPVDLGDVGAPGRETEIHMPMPRRDA